MTIKRKLFISNIMMIVVPVLLSAMVIGIAVYLALDFLDLQEGPAPDNAVAFFDAMGRIADITGSEDILVRELDSLSWDYADAGFGFALYKDEVLLYANRYYRDTELTRAFRREGGAELLSTGESTLYMRQKRGYTTLLTGDVRLWQTDTTRSRRTLATATALAAVIVILLILLTNKVITHLVTGSIAQSLHILSAGAREIRDGNLDYRILYTRNDEFAPVCSDFNDMADTLKDMVAQREADDFNRRELIAGISHDLRTPLTSVKAYLEGLMQGIAADEEKRMRYLNTVWEKTNDIEYIVNQLFLFSRLDVGEFPFDMDIVDLREELRGFIGSVSEEYARRGLTIRLEDIPENMRVCADAVQLRSVFTNLMENSLKYGRQGVGELHIAVSRVTRYASVVFHDNGPGVPDEDLNNIFGVFYRGDKARSNAGMGSGLGLAISAKIIENMGGRIFAQNGRTNGLAVVLRLPLLKEDNV